MQKHTYIQLKSFPGLRGATYVYNTMFSIIDNVCAQLMIGTDQTHKNQCPPRAPSARLWSPAHFGASVEQMFHNNCMNLLPHEVGMRGAYSTALTFYFPLLDNALFRLSPNLCALGL